MNSKRKFVTSAISEIVILFFTALLLIGLTACQQNARRLAMTATPTASYAVSCHTGCEWRITGVPDPLNHPTGLSVDVQGNLYVADSVNNRVLKLDPEGRLLARWGSIGSDDGQFRLPFGVALDAHGNIYVTEDSNHRVQKFDSNGKFLLKWGSRGAGDGQFIEPTGIAVDPAGNVYVADSQNNRIQKFDSSGKFLIKWGSLGSGDSEMNNPFNVRVNSTGDVYVADNGNKRVLKFDGDGKLLAKWSSCGTDTLWPGDVAQDGQGNLYVTNWNYGRICRFDSQGQFIGNWGVKGYAEGELAGLMTLAIDPRGHMYTAEWMVGVVGTEGGTAGENRIQKFRLPE